MTVDSRPFVQISVLLQIDAPPAVVFRFYTMLDHLRFISPRFRYEWCPKPGALVALGAVSEVRVRQGRHGLTLRFRTIRFEANHLFEDEFSTWPVKGARHLLSLESKNGGAKTEVSNVNTWDPPWYLRRLAERHEGEQRAYFTERQQNAKRIIEAVYAARREDAFREGIFRDAASVGLAPVVPDYLQSA